MNLKVSTRDIEGIVVVDCIGRVVAGDEADALREALKDALSTSKRIVLNLGEVTYIDSSGLGAMVGLYASARNAGAEIKLAALTKRIKDLLQITKLLTVFDVHDDVEKAVLAFEQGAAA